MHPKGYVCNVGKTYDGGEERRLRSRYAWTQKSKDIREQSSNLCAVCRDQGRFNYKDLEVHHILKVKDRQDLLLDDSNLICLCAEHHKQADSGQLSVDYLRKLVEYRDGKTSPMG